MKSSTISAILVLFLLGVSLDKVNAQCSITSNLVVNGDFSSGNTGFSSSYSYSSGDLHPEGKYDILTNPKVDHSNFSACGDHTTGSGNMMAINGATVAGVSVWCQTVAVSANSTYTFSAWLASVHPSNPAILQFSINGVNLGSTFTASSTTCNWQQFCETWNSGVSTSANICIVNQNTSAGGNDFALDDIQMGITAVLSVHLMKFTASNFEQGTHIKWTSASEIDHDLYVLEKSLDLHHWTEIDKVHGKGGVDVPTDYEYFDYHQVTDQTIYYRIKNIDKSGTFDYSTIKSVQAKKTDVGICPNPTYDRIFIYGAKNVKLIEVFNSLEVEEKRFLYSEPPVNLEIDLSSLKPGIYFIKIISDENNYHIERLVKR